MAQAGFTPIQLYRTTTAAAVPTSGNLSDGELAINTLDEKLYFKNSAGTVKLIAANVTAVANGGTGQTSASAAFNALSPITTTGDLILGNGTNSATRLAIGANGYILTSNGTTASWSAAPAGGVTTFSAGTTGLTPNTGTTGAVTLAGTLGVANGGTGITSTPTNGQIPIGNGTTYTASTITAGTGISVTNASGSITIAATGGGSTSIGLVRAIAINCILP
jgi:hypothetical protein